MLDGGDPDDGDTVTVKVISSLDEVSAEHWDACAGAENPFVSHSFLTTLEDSDAANGEAGWLPQHIVIEDSKCLVGVAPCYLKNNSHGEYVFDWAGPMRTSVRAVTIIRNCKFRSRSHR